MELLATEGCSEVLCSVNAAEDAPAAAKPPAESLGEISSVPSQRLALHKVLDFCQTPHTAEEIEAMLGGSFAPSAAVFTPVLMREWLERAGCLCRLEGPPDEDGLGLRAETDDTATPCLTLWVTTDPGRKIVTADSPLERFYQLLDKRPRYREIYLTVLELCREGKSGKELDALLEHHPDLQEPRMYASAFVIGLEEVGAIEWNGTWRTTEIGTKVL